MKPKNSGALKYGGVKVFEAYSHRKERHKIIGVKTNFWTSLKNKLVYFTFYTESNKSHPHMGGTTECIVISSQLELYDGQFVTNWYC